MALPNFGHVDLIPLPYLGVNQGGVKLVENLAPIVDLSDGEIKLIGHRDTQVVG
jgi:hypothetical protein